jgi:hypothetical protein
MNLFKPVVFYACLFCGACLYAALWFSPAPLFAKIAMTGVLTFNGAMLIDALFNWKA